MAKKPSIYKIQTLQWLALVSLMLPILVFSQGSIEVDGTVRDKDSNRKLAGVQVEVLRNGQPYDAVSTLASGKYNLSLDHGADYELRFTMGDLSPRKVELQTSSIPEAFRERPFYLTVEMSMFEIPPGFDESLLEQPIGKVAFDPSKEQLSWDLPYTSRMQSEIDDALEAAAGGGDEAASNKEYEEHMRKAEVEFGRERWAQSINWLDRALSVLPGDARAENMLAEAQENLAAAEEEAEARSDYDAQMREGKMAMRREDWVTATRAFEAASGIFPDEQEPKDLLADIDAATATEEDSEEDVAFESAMAEGQAAFGQQAWDEAEAAFERASELKPAERAPKDNLAEIRRLRKSEDAASAEDERRMQRYEDLIEKADRNFDSQDFVRAKTMYEQASEVMPDEVYPRMRAAESEGLIVELGEEKPVEVPDNADDSGDALNREYEDQIRRGDEAFDSEDWATAEAAYSAALELRPEERYPKNRLRRLASMQPEAENSMDLNLEIDRDALLAENEANAKAVADATAAMELEQAQILEEERLAALESETRKNEQRKAASDAGLDRSRNYVLAMQNVKEDDAEAYYRDALESEIRARGLAVYARSERQEELSQVWLSNSDTRRQSSYADVREQTTTHEALEASHSGYRSDRVVDLEVRTTRHQEQEKDWAAMGNAGRRDRFISLTRKDKLNRTNLADRTKRYAVFVDSLDRMLAAYANFNRDLRLASVDARIMRFDEIERKAAEHRRVGEGESIRRLGRWSDIQKVERVDAQAKIFAAGEASIRSAAALRKVQAKESGSAPTAEDYLEVPAKEGIRQGVEERSYEEGNALIIERTVRVENEVNVYRKTVAKHGVYYFKNNRSITHDIWVLETFEIAD